MISETQHADDNSGLFRDASLPLSVAILILVGVLLIFLGFLLFPVNLGIIPFSPDGQLGLLMVIMAIQMLAMGETPVGQYKRSWFLIIIGIIFAAMGVVSCIVPGILTGMIQGLIGILNVVGGGVLLTKRFFPLLYDSRDQTAEPPIFHPDIKKLLVTQTTLNIVSIAFGITMLVPGLVSGQIIAGILVINGCLLFGLAGILQKIT